MSVKTKTKTFVEDVARHHAGESLRVARLELGLTQTELADRFSGKSGKKSQDAVSHWERTGKVPAEVVRRVGREVSPTTRRALFEAAGIEDDTEGLLAADADTRKIELLSSPDDLGVPNVLADRCLSLPSEWLSPDANIKAARFATKLSPLFGDEVIALIDLRFRDPDRLQNCIVVARTPCGNEPMRLRKVGRTFFLEPLRGDGGPQTLRNDGDWSIIGKIVKWIGDAPSGK